VTVNPPLAVWLAWWGAMRRYHRYRVEGLERLDSRRSMLIVGYHGRPIAYDLCMLSVTFYERFGYMPHGIAHRAVDSSPLLRWICDGLGFVSGDGDVIAAAVARGEHVVVQPGGAREGCRSVLHTHEVDWGDRTGFIRLALRYGLPVVPVAARGIDRGYVGLNDGYRWGRRLRMPAGLPFWIGLGALGPWPLSPPFPVRITQYIGEPIDLCDAGPIDPGDPAALLAAQRRVARAVQAILDRVNG
jgi:1-acyl-sn-glycerol-3-phosphate acyltransferase